MSLSLKIDNHSPFNTFGNTAVFTIVYSLELLNCLCMVYFTMLVWKCAHINLIQAKLSHQCALISITFQWFYQIKTHNLRCIPKKIRRLNVLNCNQLWVRTTTIRLKTCGRILQRKTVSQTLYFILLLFIIYHV